MPMVIDLILHEPAWPDLADRADGEVIHLDGPIGLTGLAGGMHSGRPSVALRIDLPDGRVVIQQTSLLVLLNAVNALVARYGDPRQ